MPIGACATLAAGELHMTAVVTSLDGTRVARANAHDRLAEPERLGEQVAERLLAAGASDILAEVVRAQAMVEGLQP